jgi:hypothetical protein
MKLVSGLRRELAEDPSRSFQPNVRVLQINMEIN